MSSVRSVEIMDDMLTLLVDTRMVHEIMSVDCEEDEHDLCLSVFAGMLMPGSYRCTCTCHV